MILLNRKIDYALLILCYLHHRPQGGCARAIAAHFGISRAFVANILKELGHQGFVSSQRGVRGGYTLREAAGRRSLADLMDALDDAVQLAECNTAQPEDCCTLAATCPVRAPIQEVHDRIRGVLEGVRLEEIFAKQAVPIELGVVRCEPEPAPSA